MSVPKNKRNLSSLEFYHTAISLRHDLTLLLLRDFGVKDKVRNVRMFAKANNISPEDENTLTEILTKYNLENSIVEEYPEWLIDHFRTSILNILRALILNITAANSIYPISVAEFDERRIYQDRAIGNCEQLLQEMQYVIDILPVDAEKYMPYVEKIDKEIALLKGWRKGDNRLLKRIKHDDSHAPGKTASEK